MRAGPEVEFLTLVSAPAAYPNFRWQHPSSIDTAKNSFLSSLAAETFWHRKSRCKRLLFCGKNYFLRVVPVNGLLCHRSLKVNNGRTGPAGARLRRCRAASHAVARRKRRRPGWADDSPAILVFDLIELPFQFYGVLFCRGTSNGDCLSAGDIFMLDLAGTPGEPAPDLLVIIDLYWQ